MIEYLTEIVDALNDDTLNELGKSGWQLVTIYDDVAYFIRFKYKPPMAIMTLPTSKIEPIEFVDAIGK